MLDSGCSRHMTGNMSYLTDYKEMDRGYVAFGGNPKGGKITGESLRIDEKKNRKRDVEKHIRVFLRQDTMGDTSSHTRYKRVSKMSNDSLLVGVNTPQSDDDRLKHIELMKLYTTPQKKVVDLEDEIKRTKTTQQTNIDGLERRVKKLEKNHCAAKTIVTTSPTITAKSTKTNVKVTQTSKWKGVMIQEPEEKNNNKNSFFTTTSGSGQRALKNKSFAEIKELFYKAIKRINNFVDFKTELVEESYKKDEAETAQESSSKRAGDELDQERSKKQKMEDDKESAELK
nr:ribonuclease H-like domain-containing protein [Tanacetum cinerariifolium]